jgi:hypothetical protein
MSRRFASRLSSICLRTAGVIFYRGDAVGDLGLAHFRELREDAGGLIRIQLRENEGDRLRVFV